MKLFDVDWTNVFRDLPRWWALQLPARRVLLDELKTHGYIPGQRFGEQLRSVVASGIPTFDADRNRLYVGEDQRELVKVLRAMDRHRLFDAPSREALVKYLEEHFTNAEIEALGEHSYGGLRGYASRYTLAPRIAFAGWAGDLLNAHGDEELVAWGNARGWGTGQSADHRSIPVLEDLRLLAGQLVASPGGVPLRDLIAQWTHDIASFAYALHAGFATSVVFAGLRGVDLEPMVGLWPEAAHELTRPPATRPSAVVPIEQFAAAASMEDMTTLLATIVATPVRVRADDMAVFAKVRKEIETRLVALPSWAAHLYTSDGLTRVDAAAKELELHGFVQLRPQGGNPHLTATAKGNRWLALMPGERLASLIDPVRNSKDRNPRGAYDATRADRFFPFGLRYMKAPESLRLRDALTSAFLGETEGFIPLEEFLDHAAREANPFLALPRSVSRDLEYLFYTSGAEDPRESFRNIWRNMLVHFLIVRLIGVGGASIGRLENGSLCFMLTDIGRYILSAVEEFEYGSAELGAVVVQPNFDIVFLGAAPSTEATVARFAQRVGAAPGLAFKITRASVLGAAEAGATANEIIESLRGASSKALPKNVEREIAGWVGAVRRARLRALEVIECADEEVADRVGALLGAKARRLTPRIFELLPGTSNARVAMMKKLRASGVFLENTTSDVTPRSARKQRRETLWEDDEEYDEPLK